MESRVKTACVIAVCAACLHGTASRSFAQDRLPPIPADKQTEAQKKAAIEFQKERMTEVFGPFVPLSRSPELMIDAATMGTYLHFGNPSKSANRSRSRRRDPSRPARRTGLRRGRRSFRR